MSSRSTWPAVAFLAVAVALIAGAAQADNCNEHNLADCKDRPNGINGALTTGGAIAGAAYGYRTMRRNGSSGGSGNGDQTGSFLDDQ